MTARTPPNQPKSSYDPSFVGSSKSLKFSSMKLEFDDREAARLISDQVRRNHDSLEAAIIDQLYGRRSTFEEITKQFALPPSNVGAPLPHSLTTARAAVKEYLLDVEHDTAWDDIIGNEDARQALAEAIEEPALNSELFAYYGMTPAKGVMLYGPPGCGKTMFAKASAAAVSRAYGAKAEVLVINGTQIQGSYVGETERRIRAIFKYAREYKAHHKHPLVVFIDEAEVLFPDRTGRTRQVMPWEEGNVAQFLAEMDGMDTVGAFVILATNRPEAIDEALLRDGRCDRKIKVNRPTKEAVEHIVRKSLVGTPTTADLDELVMAAAESFFNPHYVIREGHLISAKIGGKGPLKFKDQAVNFCLEHIVSGAMAAGVARRAKSRAFARDKVSGSRSGIQVADVLDAVKEIYLENKPLEHSFAMREFIESLALDVAEPTGRVQ